MVNNGRRETSQVDLAFALLRLSRPFEKRNHKRQNMVYQNPREAVNAFLSCGEDFREIHPSRVRVMPAAQTLAGSRRRSATDETPIQHG
jgi:hypothetical protein